MKYELQAKVMIEESGESGKVIGRAEYSTAEPNYLVRYAARDGRATEAWWAESALVPFENVTAIAIEQPATT
jgi:hypothetical protein